jgi:pimeloyl-ACP methyl ester carboxylesterase
LKTSRIESLEIADRTLQVRHWGPDHAPLIFMFHGWMDCSATFQFVVDELRQPWHVIAPDWRGHGGSHRTGETYLFMQFVADLDAVLEHYSPKEPVTIVGHSLGANTSTLYAGVRPERVARLVNLEGVAPVPGMWAGTPAEQLGQWLTTLRRGVKNRRYRDRGALAERLGQANPRLTAERADFLARHFAREQNDGSFEFAMDPYQNARSPMIGHDRVVESTWPRIAAPVMLVTGAESEIYTAFNQSPGTFERRLALLRNVEHIQLQDVGHNMHHDRPEQVASLIERFLAMHPCAMPRLEEIG